MEEYQKRVVDERNELGVRLGKLNDFLECTASAQLEPQARTLMERQSVVMDEYLGILISRIKLFGGPNASADPRDSQ